MSRLSHMELCCSGAINVLRCAHASKSRAGVIYASDARRAELTGMAALGEPGASVPLRGMEAARDVLRRPGAGEEAPFQEWAPEKVACCLCADLKCLIRCRMRRRW